MMMMVIMIMIMKGRTIKISKTKSIVEERLQIIRMRRNSTKNEEEWNSMTKNELREKTKMKYKT